jgi:NADPH:quinone reductase-like Zn-dependent oxidoreductase
MRAIRFKAFGDPSVFELAELAPPAVDETTALMRVVAASINLSDLKNVAESMKWATLPRVPGRDFAGVVEPAGRVGSEAPSGTGGNADFARDDTHTEMIARAGSEPAPKARPHGLR